MKIIKILYILKYIIDLIVKYTCYKKGKLFHSNVINYGFVAKGRTNLSFLFTCS